jgi:hypothetical protein
MGAAGDRDNFSGDKALTVPTGGVTKGKIYLIADSYWVARETASAAATALFGSLASGSIWVTKGAATGKNFAVGDKVYVKSNVAENATSTGAVLLPCIAVSVAAATDTVVQIAAGGIAPTAS